MENKIEIFKQKFDSLILNYVDTYNGKQPIMSIINKETVRVEPEFLKHLPLPIRNSIENAIIEHNQNRSE